MARRRAGAVMRVAAGLAALVPAAGPAVAAPAWVVVPGASAVRFEFVLEGTPRVGVFEAFEGEGTLAEGAPETAELELRIDARSIDVGHTLYSAYATSPEWFDTIRHPFVVFRLLHLGPDGEGGYRTRGELTIKGTTLPVGGPVTLDFGAEGEGARATGLVRVDRVDFGLGVGPSALVVDIDRTVAVSFELFARPAE